MSSASKCVHISTFHLLQITKQNSSVIVIIRLMWSFMICPKVITMASTLLNNFKNLFNVVRIKEMKNASSPDSVDHRKMETK